MGNFIEAKEYYLNTLLHLPYIFEVPEYQRPYSWNLDQWEALFDDIDQLEENQTHFLGAIVVVPTGQAKLDFNCFHIVDGQQRLTTLFVWLIAIRDLLKETNDLEKRNLIEYLENQMFVQDFVAFEKNTKPKILLGINDREIFDLLLKGKKIPEKLQDSIIYRCYKYFYERTKNKLQLWEKILKNISIIFINAFSHFNAFRLFETLNDRGLALSAADLIKNFLLMKLSENQEEFDTGVNEWLEMYENVKNYEPIRFLRRFYLIKFNSIVSEKILYRKINSKLENAKSKDILDLLKDMNLYSEIYRKILECNFESSSINKKLKELHLVEVSPSFSFLMLLFWEYLNNNFQESWIIEILNAIENLHIRWGICSLSTARLEQVYFELCKTFQNINAENIKNKIIDKLYNIISENADDNIFTQSLLKREILWNETRSKFILWKLSMPSGENIPDFNNIHIEHIMPRKLTHQWITEISQNLNLSYQEVFEKYEGYLNKLGNLTIIRGDWNVSMSNRPFKVKQEYYSKSEFRITNTLVIHKTWDFNTIENRTKELTQKAVTEIWKIPPKKTKKLALYFDDYNVEDYQSLLITLRKLKVQRNWIEEFCEIVSKIIEKYDLDYEKKFIVYTLPKNGCLPVTIGNRYVWNIYPKGIVGIILPIDFQIDTYPDEKIIRTFTFKKNKIPDALFVEFDKKGEFKLPKDIIEKWELSIEYEVNKNHNSPFRNYNRLIHFKFLIDKNFRQSVLDEAFFKK
ncbi:MAG: DUF262 domain-containing HNH endonuclease family protein [Ignavibacteria bacterium]|nr:DUF262 domain-containing HNH endonuclease family protein [Ignavibacteria bacterium]